MTRRGLLSLSIPLALALAFSLSQATPEPPQGAEGAAPPVAVKFLRKRGGKPPMRFFDATLNLRNTHDQPVWLITGVYGDKPLPADGLFKSGLAQPFGGQGYDGSAKGGRGKAVEILFLGDPSFWAFRLPANATVGFGDYTIEAWSDIPAVEFWEVSSLLVNGRTPLEKWLPYPTLSDETAVIPAGTDWKNLDWDPVKLTSRTDYPKEAVKTVTATVLKKWTVPIMGMDKGGGK